MPTLNSSTEGSGSSNPMIAGGFQGELKSIYEVRLGMTCRGLGPSRLLWEEG